MYYMGIDAPTTRDTFMVSGRLKSVVKHRIFGQPFVKRFALCYRTVVCLSCLSCPDCNVGVLWPNALTDQDETWHVGRPQPRRLCVRWRPSSPHPKRGVAPPPKKIGPCLLWPNGWMDQDGTWHGDRPQPKRLCVKWGPSPLNFRPMFIIVIVIWLKHCTGVRCYWFVQVEVKL